LRFQLSSVCTVALILGGFSAIPVQAAQAKAKPARAEGAQPDRDWPQFLHGPRHSSRSLAAAFTPPNAASVRQSWHWQPPVVTGKPAPVLDASPTVVGGRVYIGGQSGMFYALNEAQGAVVWSRQLGIRPHVTCRPLGITSTAAVLPDPVSGTSTVYVSGARYLYALDAATGAVSWQTEIGPPSTSNPDAYYNWSSPTVIDGHIYVGMASGCDEPLIRGGVVELDQHSGHVLRTWYSVPAGSIGGSVWSSVAASANGHDLWVSTGNECDPTINTCPAGNKAGHSLSIVHLSASLKLLQSWQAPGTAGSGHDWDFGASPSLFGSSGMPATVGACNKNGDFYALTANPLASSPLWTDVIAAPDGTIGSCFASADWDAPARDLYLSGGATTIGTTRYGGSIDKVSPATGAYIWRTGLPCTVVGTPTLDSAGVLAVGTYRCVSPNTPGAYLVDAATGAILTTLPVGSTRVFGQPVFAQGALFVATETNGLYDFVP
jgi:outer membrane protein assembly factor BamB